MNNRRVNWRAVGRETRAIVVVIALLATMRSSIADWNDVPTQSMEPTILTGDRIAVNKVAYDLRVPFTYLRLATWSDPAPGEVVVFFAPHNDVRMVKRVVGTPGDAIAMRNGRLIVNDRAVDLTPSELTDLGTLLADADELADRGPHRFAREQLGAVDHAVMAQPGRRMRRNFATVVVPPGAYFVMGDNRDNSGDSRVFGFVPRERIVGRVSGIAFSFDHRGGFGPRWERFFRGIE